MNTIWWLTSPAPPIYPMVARFSMVALVIVPTKLPLLQSPNAMHPSFSSYRKVRSAFKIC